MVTVGAWDAVDKTLLTPAGARERYGHLAALYTAGGLGRHTTFERMRVPTVTTLTGWLEVCSLQTWFKSNFPILEEASSLYVRLRGTIYHSALAAGPGAQEVPLFDRTEDGILWGGFIDGYDEETGILYETKTTRPDSRTGRMRTEDLPKREHSLQTRFYAHLLAEHGFEVKKTLITYFTFDEYRTYEVHDRPLTETFIGQTVKGTSDAMRHPQGQYRARWACLATGTMVLTGTRGWRPVEEVTTADTVQGRCGDFHPVMHTQARPVDREMVHVKPYCFPGVTLTHDHQVLVRRWGSPRMKQLRKGETEEKWVKASELDPSLDHLLWTVDQRVRDLPDLTEKDLRLIGYYVAEGNLSDRRPDGGYYKVHFTLGAHEEDFSQDIQTCLRARFGDVPVLNHTVTDSRNGNHYRVVQGHRKAMADFISLYVHGRNAREKRLDESLMTLPPERQRVLLDAMVRGDGWRGKVRVSSIVAYGTASRVLAHQVQQMALRLGWPATLVTQNLQPGGFRTKPTTFYYVRWHVAGKTRYTIKDGNRLWVPLQHVTRNVEYVGDVHDLSTDHCHAFLTEMGIVHNCSYCPFYRYCTVGHAYLVDEYLKSRRPGYPELMPAVEPSVLSVGHLSEIARKPENRWAVDLLQSLPPKESVPVLTWPELRKRGQVREELPFTRVPGEAIPPPTEG